MPTTLYKQCVGSLMSQRIYMCKGCETGAYGLSSLSEKTRKSNHLQMSLQRQHSSVTYWVLVRAGFEPAAPCSADQHLSS